MWRWVDKHRGGSIGDVAGVDYVYAAEPSRAEPCRAVPCRAVPCRAVPCGAYTAPPLTCAARELSQFCMKLWWAQKGAGDTAGGHQRVDLTLRAGDRHRAGRDRPRHQRSERCAVLPPRARR